MLEWTCWVRGACAHPSNSERESAWSHLIRAPIDRVKVASVRRVSLARPACSCEFFLFPLSVSRSDLLSSQNCGPCCNVLSSRMCQTCPQSPHSSPAPKSGTVLSLFGLTNLVGRALLRSTSDELATQNQNVDLKDNEQGCWGYGGPWSSLGRCMFFKYYGAFLRAPTSFSLRFLNF
jgi:hypothetical protein